jgi:dipeptidyl aminopeptidase/acylaminoacyl peptidase
MIYRVSLAATLILAVIAHAPTPFALDQILAHPFPENLTASKTGSAIAWTFNERGLRNIYIAEGSAFKPRRLTNYSEDDGRELADLSFSEDGRYLVFVRGGNREAKSPEVWSVTTDDAVLRRLGDGEKPVIAPRNHRVAFLRDRRLWVAPIDGSSPAQIVYVRGASEALSWSPDGEMLAFASNRDSHGFITLFTRVDQPVRYIAPSTSRDSMPVWSPDSNRLAFVRQPGQGPGSFLSPAQGGWTIWLSDLRDETAREVWRSGSRATDSLPEIEGSPNLRWGGANRLVFLSYQDGWPHLYSVPVVGGAALLLTPGPFMVDRLSLTPDGRWIIYSANAGSDREDLDRRHLFKVPVDAAQPTQLTTGRGIEWGPVITGDGRSLAFLSSTALRGSLPAIRSLDGAEARTLGDDHVPVDFPTAGLVTPESVIIRGNDGGEVHGQLFKTNATDTPRPALLFVHDGPAEQMLLGWHYSYDHAFAYALNQYLANRGFVVLSVNYRSSIGYGYAYQQATVAGGPPGYDDMLAAARYLQARSDVDPKRVGIWGASYGGYLTAVALARNSDLFAAGVDVDGSADLISHEIENLTMSVDDECTVTVSSLHWTAPALIIHGDDDGSTRFRLTEQLDRQLRGHGAPIETEVIPTDTLRHLAFKNRQTVAGGVAGYFERVLLNRMAK